MPVEENFDCRRKRVLVHRLDIPCHLEFKYKWVDQTARRGEAETTIKITIICHTLNKYHMLIRTYLHLLSIHIVYFVLENGNFVLEMSGKIIFPCLWELCAQEQTLKFMWNVAFKRVCVYIYGCVYVLFPIRHTNIENKIDLFNN